jgi:hypothetical protein
VEYDDGVDPQADDTASDDPIDPQDHPYDPKDGEEPEFPFF